MNKSTELGTLKVIITGTKTFSDYEYLENTLNIILQNFDFDIEVVCGLAKGTNSFGEIYALKNNYLIKYFATDKSLGKLANFIKNEEMVNYADMLIAFWDGKSEETKHMIENIRKQNKKCIVINYLVHHNLY